MLPLDNRGRAVRKLVVQGGKESKDEKKRRLGRLFDAFFEILKPYCIVIDEDGKFWDGINLKHIPSNAVKLIVKREYPEKFNNYDWEVVVFTICKLLSSDLIRNNGLEEDYREAEALVLNNPYFEEWKNGKR